jgi:predicted metal-binding protein
MADQRRERLHGPAAPASLRASCETAGRMADEGGQRSGGRAGRGGATLRICTTCRWQGRESMPDADVRPGEWLHDLVRARARPDQKDRVQGIVCLTHCLNACNAVAMQRGKVPLLMTRMAPDEATADALLEMLDRFAASETGQVPDAEVPAAIPLARPLIPQGVGRGRASQ